MATLQDFVQNPLLFDAVLAIAVGAFFAWLAWVWEHRPKPKNASRDPYIDDYMIRKVEIFNCELDWGTRLYPSSRLMLKEISVLSDFVIRYSPPGGTELDLDERHFEARPKAGLTKTIWLKEKSFFRSQGISHVVLTVLTPIERGQYALNIRIESRGNVIHIWNDNHEEIRNFRLTLPKPIKLSRISVTKGSINSFDIEIPYSTYKYVKTKEIGDAENDVSVSLILDLPPKRTDGQEQVTLRIS